MTKKKERRCQTCAAWRQLGQEKSPTRGYEGRCYRRPPDSDGFGLSYSDQWCLEWISVADARKAGLLE